MSDAPPRASLHSLPSRDHDKPGPVRLSPGVFVGEFVRESAAADIWKIAHEFPHRWSVFLMQAFGGDPVLIQNQFQVCERTVRRWLNGDGGVRAPHQVVAQQTRPEEYTRIILDQAA